MPVPFKSSSMTESSIILVFFLGLDNLTAPFCLLRLVLLKLYSDSCYFSLPGTIMATIEFFMFISMLLLLLLLNLEWKEATDEDRSMGITNKLGSYSKLMLP